MLLNRAQVGTTTTGTGAVALGSAVSGMETWAAAGAVAGRSYSYLITEGTAWEIGTGVYDGTNLSRPGPSADPSFASSTGALITLAGAAVVGCVANKRDYGWTKLDEVHGDGTSNTLSITGIDASLTDLLIISRARSTGSDGGGDAHIQFNGDGTTNYLFSFVAGGSNSGFNPQAQGNYSAGNNWPGPYVEGTSETGGVFVINELTIFNYADTNGVKEIHGQFRGPHGLDVSNSRQGVANFVCGSWGGTAAISSVSTTLTTGNFAAGSSLRVYGRA